MEILRFTLSGRHAFFKKPEVNSYYYFTYGNIHKVALLGIFGAMLGYGGYTQMQGFSKERNQKKLSKGYPEFYERLKDLHVSVLPAANCRKGIIPKKVQTFNNSVGYASREQGGNLIVREQWLENPCWEICLLLDTEEAVKIKDAVCGLRCVYYPYLGKNDHPADIKDARIEEIEKIDFKMGRLDCFVPKEEAVLADLDDEEQEDLDAYSEFKYEEALPCGMDEWTNQYVLRTFMYTDAFVKAEHAAVYRLQDGKKIMFY